MAGRLAHDALLRKNCVNNVPLCYGGLAHDLDSTRTLIMLVNTQYYSAKCAIADVGDEFIICG